jgi:structural maintenance of chromosome 1
MSSICSGIHGRLVDLCRPVQTKYSLPINIILNKYFDAIVVDTRQIAAQCINYSKEHHFGSCTFLPLDNLNVSAPSARFRESLSNKYKLCMDVLEYDNIYKNAIVYAVGSTVICETLEDAQELAFNGGQQVMISTRYFR